MKKFQVYKIQNGLEIEVTIKDRIHEALDLVNSLLRENAEQREINPNHPIALYSYRRIDQH